MLSKPLEELTDTELLDLLDLVSDEVKRRNSLNVHLGNEDVEDQSVKRAIDFLSNAVSNLSTNR